MWVSHAPVKPPARRFLSLSEWCPEHYSVCPANHRLTNIPTSTKPPVGYDGDIPASTSEIVLPCGRALERSGYLRNANTNYFAGGAGGARSDSDQETVDTSFHQLGCHLISNAIPNYHWNFQGVDKF